MSTDPQMGAPSQPPAPEQGPRKPFYKRWWFIAVAVIVVLGGVGNIAPSLQRTTGTPASPTAAPANPEAAASAAAAQASADAEKARAAQAKASAEAADAAAAKASAEAEAAAAAQASAEAAAAKEAAAVQEFSGKGDDVVRFADFQSQAVAITLTHSGSRNFAVWSVDDQGENIDLLVNDIGSYSGAVPLNFVQGEEPAGLAITASGSWTATTVSVTKLPAWDGGSTYSGEGDAVVNVMGAVEGLTPVTITNSGERNFVVIAWGDRRELLVNGIGNYSGKQLLPNGTLLLEVTSSGKWTLEK